MPMPNEIWTGSRYYVERRRTEHDTLIWWVCERQGGDVTPHFTEVAALSQAKRLDFEYRQQQLDL